MSRRLYQDSRVITEAMPTAGRHGFRQNEGIMRSVRAWKREEAEERAEGDHVGLARFVKLKAIAEKQPDRYAIVGTGKSAKMIRIDLS